MPLVFDTSLAFLARSFVGLNVRLVAVCYIPANELLDILAIRLKFVRLIAFDGLMKRLAMTAHFPTYEDSHRLEKSDRTLIP